MNSIVRRLAACLVLLPAAILGGQGAQLPKHKVSTLPNPTLFPTYTVQVIDGATAVDCTVGGGHYNVICMANGSQWAPQPGYVSLTAGPTTTLPAGSPATTTITGTSPNQVLSLGIPAGVPGGSLSYPGCTTDGSNGFMCPTGNVFGQAVGGARYAAQYQTGGGNNGIANAQASMQTVIADPSYALTEFGYVSTIPTFSNTPMAFKDWRGSQDLEYYRNPGTTATGALSGSSRNGWYGLLGKGINCMWDTTFAPGSPGDLRPNCMQVYMTRMNPGFAAGNAAIPPNGWQAGSTFSVSSKDYGAGTLESYTLNQTKNGIGDNAGIYCYVQGQGGQRGASDEANKCFAANMNEQTNHWAGTVTGGPLTNPTQLKATAIAGGDLQGTGRMLIYRGACSSYPATCPAAPYTGVVTASTNAPGSAGGLTALTLSGTVPVSNAYGKLTANCNTGTYNNTPPFTTAIICQISITSGTLDTTHLVCFQGNFHDCAVPTAVTATTMNIALRHQHQTGTFWYQGGLAGYGIEFSAYSSSVSGGGTQPLRYIFDVFGSTGPNTVQAGYFRISIGQFVTVGVASSMTLGVALTSNGTTVAGTSATQIPPNIPVVISNADDAALNGVCTGLAWQDATHFTCTNSGLSGTHSNTSATPIAKYSMNNLSLDAYNIWPMAEVIDVRNTTATPPVVDGTLALEPNVLGTLNTGDVLEELHDMASEWNGETNNIWVYNPLATVSTNVIAGSGNGAGICCGGGSLSSNSMFRMVNSNPDTMYQGGGGVIVPPNMATLQGAYFNGILMDHGPASGAGGAWLIQPRTYQTNDPNYTYNVFSAFDKSSSTFLSITPFTGDATLSTPRVLTLSSGTGALIRDIGANAGGTVNTNIASHNSITMVAATAISPTLTPRAYGGTLADGSYCYQTQASTSGGVTGIPQTQVCATITGGGGFGSIAISWPAVLGASGYWLDGRTSGAEQRLSIGPTVTSLVDDGSLAFSGSEISGNTLPGLDQSGFVGFNSFNTANEVTVKAPPSLGSAVAITLPSTSGTLPISTTTPTVGKATCWKTTTTIGYCSTQPDATGACTCN